MPRFLETRRSRAVAHCGTASFFFFFLQVPFLKMVQPFTVEDWTAELYAGGKESTHRLYHTERLPPPPSPPAPLQGVPTQQGEGQHELCPARHLTYTVRWLLRPRWSGICLCVLSPILSLSQHSVTFRDHILVCIYFSSVSGAFLSLSLSPPRMWALRSRRTVSQKDPVAGKCLEYCQGSLEIY